MLLYGNYLLYIFKLQAVRQGEHLSLLKLADEKQKQEQKKHIENLKKMLQV